ncbi:uncharacterized protein FIBRA_07609 [Fibroporia radiculosa]|uniref:SUZ domain-containing protein n=1 Tax=Fibroporia radiculosa TaxID=599839 RepID=J4GF38_9APHY|nr:uncharacterized protein FIBRA_07609 [Fibroporia radiculosa]CCM05393.1 predicted protein [Fibroporia radiculosa]
MPELVMTGSSTNSVVSPPLAAFQPTLRILKRPTAASTSTFVTSTPQSDVQKTYAEREAQYQAARERIFTENARDSAEASAREDSGRSSGAKAAMNGRPSRDANIIRDPRGPNAESTHTAFGDKKASRGFTGRRGKGNPRDKT